MDVQGNGNSDKVALIETTNMTSGFFVSGLQVKAISNDAGIAAFFHGSQGGINVQAQMGRGIDGRSTSEIGVLGAVTRGLVFLA